MSSTGSHLLSLKVMRVSRPSLTSAWEPFYSSSPAFSARSTTSIVSLQGKTALPGHPKTLRDLTHVTEMLMLPASFGAIQLGETFISCLSVNNEGNVPVEAVTLSVEVQTASTKTVVAEFGGEGQQLAPGNSLERVVSREIKELGQHALACTVSYRAPPGTLASTSAVLDSSNSEVHTFRKFYKFVVTNPLSVKTKVHVPRAPSAVLSRAEREKVFLEIHIQNLTQDAMWLERMHLECADGWQVKDANLVDGHDGLEKESIFSGSMALMQPQDLRQYIYVLSPLELALFPVAHQPGSIIPLGRLDISWRSSFGEPGRLLTSMLSRRIPLIQAPAPAPTPPPKQPVSAIPLHLQRGPSVASPSPSRPRSPQLNQRPTSPTTNAPYRPHSPHRSRTAPSPAVPSPAPHSALASVPRREKDVQVDLVVRKISHDTIRVEKPFTVAFTVNVAAPVPILQSQERRQSRILSLAVQHIRHPQSAPSQITAAAASSAAQIREPQSPQLASGMSTPSPFGTPQRADFQDFLSQRLLAASLRGVDADDDGRTETGGPGTPAPDAPPHSATVILPPPFTNASGGNDSTLSPAVVYQGSSALFLPPLTLTAPFAATSAGDDSAPTHERNLSASTTDSKDSEMQDSTRGAMVRVVGSQGFELSYLPLRAGFATFGGLRVLLIEDRMVDEGEVHGLGTAGQDHPQLRTLKEWDVVGEVWIDT